MSFRCEECGEKQKHGTRPHRRVTRLRRAPMFGWNIVQEKNFCAKCVDIVELPEIPERVVRDDRRLTVPMLEMVS